MLVTLEMISWNSRSVFSVFSLLESALHSVSTTALALDFHSSHHGFSDNLFYTVAEKKQVLQGSGLFPYLVFDRSAKRHL
jgi:hypothetical protein